jgi:superfamily II DNA or RNA helicase
MLKDIVWSDDRAYRTGSDFEPIQFYIDALNESTSFDLMLGYFSSAAISVLSLSFAKFLSSGGTVRIIINDLLSSTDREVINKVAEGYIYQLPFDLSNFSELKSRLDDYDTHFFQCLGWLIQNNRIQIKVIRPLEKKGISHYKSGVFYDGQEKVGFGGSCNFTAFGLSENLEEMDAFLSWENGRSNKWINARVKYFESIFDESADFVEYIDPRQIRTAIATEFGDKDIDELLIKESELIELKENLYRKEKVRTALQNAKKRIEDILDEPRYPPRFNSRQYQQDAYQSWISNDYKGLFAMATGTGKTVTSLSCVLEEYKLHNYYQFFILVPTVDLAVQWENEVVNKFNFTDTVVCSSKNLGWEKAVRSFGSSLKFGNKVNFCIIVTYASFRGKKFQGILHDLFEYRFADMTVIADEAHTLGSPKLLKVLPTKIPRRIGLSATPERVYDKEGEAELSKFFQSNAPLYTFSYNMKEAIDNGVLCKYYYYPKLVELDQDELVHYQEISKKLAKYIDPLTGKYKDDPVVENLLIQRKNIIHKARNKSESLIQIVDAIGAEKFTKAFIYVPEGYEANYADTDQIASSDEDERIIDKYTELLYEKYKFRLRKFTGDTGDRDEILEQFSNGKLDALLAMKCLDEGVDVPSTEIAVFCSSTGNPRQYIQRRGRVLRQSQATGKEVAYIYDMIVKPAIDITSIDPVQMKTEKNILLGEMRRLVNFAVLSENMLDTLQSLEELCLGFGIDIYEMSNIEIQKYNLANEKS